MSESTQAQMDALSLTVCRLQAELSQLKADRDACDAAVAEAAAANRAAIESACGSVISSFNGAVQMNVGTGELKFRDPEEASKPTGEPRFITAGKLSDVCGQLDCDLKTGVFTVRSPSGAVSWGDLEKGEVTGRIDPGSDVESLDLGGVTLYGDLAVKVREVQGILAAHGAGELKVVKPKVEEGKDFLVVDGQMFISQACVDASKLAAGYAIKTETLGNGLEVMAGLISESQLGEELRKRTECISADDGLACAVRQVIREELRPGGMLNSR
ncbi:hypothetical protein [Pseudomonas sp. 2835]|uniref:hypothetical protein n=1 Tax=Pseudomonas sp. 2835 TaxID=3156451 RepID=UPI003D195C7C